MRALRPDRILRAFSEEPATSQREKDRRVERSYLRHAGVGVQFGLTILIFVLGGIWLDARLGTSPLFTVLLLILGFVGATVSLIRRVLGPGKKDE